MMIRIHFCEDFVARTSMTIYRQPKQTLPILTASQEKLRLSNRVERSRAAEATGRRSVMLRIFLGVLMTACMILMAGKVLADDSQPDKLIDRLSNEVLGEIKSDAKIKEGDFGRISALVDKTIMPHVNFERMTALAVGRGWRNATPDQRVALSKEFRTLLLRTYSGAMTQIRDESIRMKPLRARADADEVIVRSEIVGRGDPIQLNYRMEKSGNSWRIFDLNVLGVWLVETYRGQFKQITDSKGVDGLIDVLTKKNESFAQAQTK
ncbi:MAG: ABC transporter substrate-binding protein [Burkholderiaceae bacterium]